MITSYLALDIGQARVGVAVANSVARIAAPLPAIPYDDQLVTRVQQLAREQQADALVVGYPRGLDGQHTAQTAFVDEVVARLRSLSLPVHVQDEAVTSVAAESELRARGTAYNKGDIDSLSAVYILEDYLQDHVH